MIFKQPIPYSLPGLPGARKCSKICDEVCKGAAPLPYDTALQRLRLFSLIRRRLRGDLICMYKIMHGLLDFPCDAVFAATTRIGLRGHTFKIHQQRCKTRRRQHAFSVQVVPYWDNLPEEIANAPSVETLKLRQDARLQPLFPDVPLSPVPRYALPNLSFPVVSHPYAITVIILGRL